MTPSDQALMSAAEAEVAEIAQNLIRFDTSNYGEGRSNGEADAAAYCAALLTEAGLDVETVESEPGRASIVTRIAGSDPGRPALVLHGHTDVVPAEPADWARPPFAGDMVNGMLWGRGAVDMKGMDAMILAVVRQMSRAGQRPRRDVIVAMFADEEAGGVLGAQWLVNHRPDLFAGATEAISEVGGFSVQIAGRRAYLLQTAEKGLAWLRLVMRGQAGHGSAVTEDNAVAKLAESLVRIGRYEWPISLNSATVALLQGVADLTGLPFHAPGTASTSATSACATTAGSSGPEISSLADQTALRDQVAQLVAALGPAAKFVAATTRNTVNATGLAAGYKANVIPSEATATLDARPLPGEAPAMMSVLRKLAGPDAVIEPIHEDIGLEAPVATPLVAAMAAAIQAEDPGAPVLPYCLGAGTDNKALARLGIAGYGFAPLRLPAELDFTGLFHGVDERVPVASLQFGTRVLASMLANC